MKSFDIITTETTCHVLSIFTNHFSSNIAGVGSNQAIASMSHRFFTNGSFIRSLCSIIHRFIFLTSVLGLSHTLISSSIAILCAAAQNGIATVFPFNWSIIFMSDHLGTYKDTLLSISFHMIVRFGFLLSNVAAG
jgi:hypothetical protein